MLRGHGLKSIYRQLTLRWHLQGYTAAAAIQAGYLEDGLDLIRHIGILNLRLGLGWAQNLWNPGWVHGDLRVLSYAMTAACLCHVSSVCP